MNKNKILEQKCKMMDVIIGSGTFINVDSKSDTSLGKRLSMTYSYPIKTPFGISGSIRNFLDYMSKENYPIDFLSKRFFTDEEFDKIPKKPIFLPNYWGLVAYILTERVLQDKSLYDMIKNNDHDYVSFRPRDIVKKRIMNTDFLCGISNPKMGYYISIIRYITTFIKEDNFNKQTASELIECCMYHPELPLFKGTPVEHLYETV